MYHLFIYSKGTSNNVLTEPQSGPAGGSGAGPGHGRHPMASGNNNLNINLPENNNAILRLEVELRDKNVPKYRRGGGVGGMAGAGRGASPGRGAAAAAKRVAPGGPAGGAGRGTPAVPLDRRNLVVPLEKVSPLGNT